MSQVFALCPAISLILAVTAFAQSPPSRSTPEQAQATRDIHEFFRRKTLQLAAADLAEVKTLADWQRLRPIYRERLFDMLGLSPLPLKTDLKPVITGTVDGGDFVVEKLHFQSRPGLYVTANFYRPKTVTKPLPTILYVCGHGNERSADKKLSFGSKTSYQHHAAWYARHGYCCLILDTLQLGEIEGHHHGTYREGQWWWAACGYTPAGVEAWNGIRALDYLETRPEVDAKKIGVTGRSGGGAYTWWIAALDDRPACVVPVAGITDLQNHVVDHCIEGHCDCMFMVNTFAWDFATVAALASPRPLLFSNTDKDRIFPLEGVSRTHAKLRRIYELHGATDKLGLLITEGPHKDTQELQVPAFRWMNRWLKDESAPIVRAADKPFVPNTLTVFDKLPADQINTTIQETFVPRAEIAAPATKDQWETQRTQLLRALREKSFRNWPAENEPLQIKVTAETESEGMKLREIEFTTEENLRLRVYVVQSAKHANPSLLVLSTLDTAEWTKWLGSMAPAFGKHLPGGSKVEADAKAFADTKAMMDANAWAFAVIAPRGEGPNRWDPDTKADTHIRRRFMLLGRTVDDVQVWDTRRALQASRSQDDLKAAKPWLQGTGRMAGVALYAGLFEPSVERFDLHALPVSHRSGPIFLNVLRVLDMPQAVALAFPRKVMLYDVEPKTWTWTQGVAKLFDAGKPPLQLRSTPLR